MKYTINSILLFTAFIFSCNVNAQKKIVLDEVVGVIGDEVITKFEVESRYSSMISQGMQISDNSRCEVLEEVLYSKMLLNQARLDSIEVNDAQIEAEIDRRLRYFISQYGSEENMVNVLQKTVTQIRDEMRKPLKNQMLIQSMRSNLTSNVQITPAEVEDYYKRIPKDSLPLISAEVEIAQLVLYAPPSRASKKEVTDKLNAFKKRVEEGENFSTLAVLYSEDKGSALRGGEIGFVGRAEVQPEFSAAAFKLKPGNVSPVVKTKFGYHIIQMIERRGDKVNVRHILLKPKVDYISLDKAKNELDSISNLIKENELLTFEKAAKKYSEDSETKNNGGIIVNPYNSSSMIPMDMLNEIDPTLFFVIDKLEVGEFSAPSQIQDPASEPGYRLVQLNKRTDPHRANLSTDYQKIKVAAKAEKEQTELEKWVQRSIDNTYINLEKKYTDGCKFAQDWEQFAE